VNCDEKRLRASASPVFLKAPCRPLPRSVRSGFLITLVCVGAVWQAGFKLAHAQAAPDSPAAATSPSSSSLPASAATPANASEASAFDIRVEAPAEVRGLLERHLQLQRYRAVTDLDDRELARLIVLAEEDVRRLVGTLGYFSPSIAISRSPLLATASRPTIVVKVEPGAATRAAQVELRFKGDIAASPDADAAAQRQAIERDWRLPKGQRFTQDSWDGAKSQALRQLIERRYPAASISYSLADMDAPARAAYLTLELDSGPLYRLGELQVSGLSRYDPVLVPRLTRLRPGDVYDQRQLVDAQQRLARSGYFDSAYVTVDPGSDPVAAPVTVQLREAQMQKIVLGVGLTTDSGPRASVEHTHNRLPGIGWRTVTKMQLEKKSPFAQTEWTSLPDDANWRWVTLARTSWLDDGELVTRAQTLRFGRLKGGEQFDRNLYLQYDRATVTGSGAASALDDARIGDGSALSANYGWTGRYFDSLPFPSRGYGLGFDAGGGSTLSGQRHPYARAVGRWLGILPLGPGRMAMRAEGGALLAASEATIPSTQLFRTGGDTSVRGYALREIGVSLPNGSTGPGRYLAVASAEWQQAILRGGLPSDWEGTLFVDAGNVADNASDLRHDVALGVGAGARWKSPIGPLQIDLAYGVKLAQVRLHMSVGFVF
jgi:translocation and assembly module TamA